MHRRPRLEEAWRQQWKCGHPRLVVSARGPHVRAHTHGQSRVTHERRPARARAWPCWAGTHLRLPSPSPPALNPLRSEAIRFAWPRAARWVMPYSFIANTLTGEPYSQPRTRLRTRVCFTAFSFLGGAICADIANACCYGCGRADAQLQWDGVAVRCDEPQVRTRFFSAFFAAVQLYMYSSVKFAIFSHVFLRAAVPGRPWDRGRARRSDIFLARQNAWRPGDHMNPSENHT